MNKFQACEKLLDTVNYFNQVIVSRGVDVHDPAVRTAIALRDAAMDLVETVAGSDVEIARKLHAVETI